jgi:DNA-directed RNA polymerase specialized sigma24 family protein
LTLVARLAQGGSESDWREFLADYWGPVSRFAARIGGIPAEQGEDVAAEAMLVLVRSPLLSRWHDHRTGKLRSLMCGVIRNVLSNQRRVARGRQRLLKELADQGGLPDVLSVSETAEPSASDLDAFYKAWVDELLASTLRELLSNLHAEGRGDYFRALYGRVCEGLSAADIGELLGADAATVENYLRVGKSRLTQALREAVRRHVQRYSPLEEVESEFRTEWEQLGSHLQRYGGLEQVLRAAASALPPLPSARQPSALFQAVSARLGRETESRPPQPPRPATED